MINNTENRTYIRLSGWPSSFTDFVWIIQNAQLSIHFILNKSHPEVPTPFLNHLKIKQIDVEIEFEAIDVDIIAVFDRLAHGTVV